jgi:hypothetical protein
MLFLLANLILDPTQENAEQFTRLYRLIHPPSALHCLEGLWLCYSTRKGPPGREADELISRCEMDMWSGGFADGPGGKLTYREMSRSSSRYGVRVTYTRWMPGGSSPRYEYEVSWPGGRRLLGLIHPSLFYAPIVVP